jgi:DNA-binding protein HU-beta
LDKKNLIKAVSVRSKLSKKDAESAVEAVFDLITKSLVSGDSLALLGFGKFEICQREAHNHIDPKTGEKSIIQACKVPVFRASKSLIQPM